MQVIKCQIFVLTALQSFGTLINERSVTVNLYRGSNPISLLISFPCSFVNLNILAVFRTYFVVDIVCLRSLHIATFESSHKHSSDRSGQSIMPLQTCGLCMMVSEEKHWLHLSFLKLSI